MSAAVRSSGVCLVVAAGGAAAAAAAGIPPAAAAAAAQLCKQQISAAALLQKYQVFVFDCDGVLWHGSILLPGIRQMLHQLQQTRNENSSSSSSSNRESSKTVYFLSNNSTLSRKGFVAKLNALGIQATEEQVVCTSYSTARYILEQQKKQQQQRQNLLSSSCRDSEQQQNSQLQQQNSQLQQQNSQLQQQNSQLQQQKSRVYVVGEQGLLDELRENGIDAFGGPEEPYEEVDFATDPEVPIHPNVGFVVVGLDRNFAYKRLQTAQLYINELGAQFIGTNTDALGNFSTKQKWAGAGSMVAAVAAACKKTPTLMGKPSPQMKRLLLEILDGRDLSRVLLVGDSLTTDISFAASANIPSCLCLTGVTGAAQLFEAFAAAAATEESAAPEASVHLPNYIVESAAHIAT